MMNMLTKNLCYVCVASLAGFLLLACSSGSNDDDPDSTKYDITIELVGAEGNDEIIVNTQTAKEGDTIKVSAR